MIFSCIIPAKDPNDPKLQDLIDSIRSQDFPQHEIEIITVTEGDSESAKAIGIRQAKGEICAMFCADNYIADSGLFTAVYSVFVKTNIVGVYSRYYAANKNDNSLNRYFSLIGNNDPIAFYLQKNDRLPQYEGDSRVGLELIQFAQSVPSLGDNGFFYSREKLLKADIDHYYPMDCAEDLRRKGDFVYCRMGAASIWHRTSDKLIPFLIKRYKYARDLYCDRNYRRWKMVDTKEDILRLGMFIGSTITIIPCLIISLRGFIKVRDVAWFWHWPVCFGFLVTYTILGFRNLIKHGALFQKSQSLSPQ